MVPTFFIDSSLQDHSIELKSFKSLTNSVFPRPYPSIGEVEVDDVNVRKKFENGE